MKAAKAEDGSTDLAGPGALEVVMQETVQRVQVVVMQGPSWSDVCCWLLLLLLWELAKELAKVFVVDYIRKKCGCCRRRRAPAERARC